MATVMTKHVHGYENGFYVVAKPGDPVPDWVKNPKAYATIEDEPVEPTEPAPKTPRKRAPKADPEPTLAERAKTLGIDPDPDWTEAELEAAIAAAE